MDRLEGGGWGEGLCRFSGWEGGDVVMRTDWREGGSVFTWFQCRSRSYFECVIVPE